MIRITNIVCPVDFFPASLRAFDYALKFAHDNGGKVYAPCGSAGIPAAYDFPVDTSRLTEGLEKESKRQMIKLEQKAKKAGVKIQTAVRIGIIDSEILNFIAWSKADLVVMGTHGRRGIERWFVGSVAERMMRRCPAPLLTIPPQGLSKKRTATKRKRA